MITFHWADEIPIVFWSKLVTNKNSNRVNVFLCRTMIFEQALNAPPLATGLLSEDGQPEILLQHCALSS